MSNDVPRCGFCGEEVDGEFVMLNRYVVGNDRLATMVESRTRKSDQYVWDETAKSVLASGPLLHFPGCLCCYLEGKFVETQAWGRGRR